MYSVEKLSGFVDSDSYNIVFNLYTDKVKDNEIDNIHRIIKNHAEHLKNKGDRGVTNINISKNEEEELDGWAWELVYVLDENSYTLYNVDFNVTYNSSISDLKDIITLFRSYYEEEDE